MYAQWASAGHLWYLVIDQKGWATFWVRPMLRARNLIADYCCHLASKVRAVEWACVCALVCVSGVCPAAPRLATAENSTKADAGSDAGAGAPSTANFVRFHIFGYFFCFFLAPLLSANSCF